MNRQIWKLIGIWLLFIATLCLCLDVLKIMHQEMRERERERDYQQELPDGEFWEPVMDPKGKQLPNAEPKAKHEIWL